MHFCHYQEDQDQEDHDEINPIGMYDSSNETSQRTEYGSVKRFDVLPFFLWQNSVFCAAGHELEPKVKYFKKFSSNFNKQGLK